MVAGRCDLDDAFWTTPWRLARFGRSETGFMCHGFGGSGGRSSDSKEWRRAGGSFRNIWKAKAKVVRSEMRCTCGG